jgi:Uma2 family endonuclease
MTNRLEASVMVSISKPSDGTTASELVRRRPFTVDDYYRMAEVGILGPDDREELLDGDIFPKNPEVRDLAEGGNPFLDLVVPGTSTCVETWRFSVADYYRMAEAGILRPDERLELIDGVIIAMSPIGNRHAACVDRFNDLLKERIGRRAIVRIQSPIHLGDRSEPQPDLALLRPRSDYYASAHPGPSDVHLVIEVMDTTAQYDRSAKLPLYARAGITEVWLVDLEGQAVEVYRRPAADQYTERSVHPRGQGLSPEAFPDVVLAVDAILG